MPGLRVRLAHVFIREDDDCVSCLTCGAHYCDSDRENSNGCTGDTSMVHGDPYESGHQFHCRIFLTDDTCPHVDHSCDCALCRS